MRIAFLFLLFSSAAFAEINMEKYEISGEYGFAYQSLEGEQKSNNSKGRLTSDQYPYWNGSLAMRLSQNWGIRFFAGFQFVRFNEPTGTQELKSEKKELFHYGAELITRTGPHSRIGYFLMQQERPLYYTKAPGDYEVIKEQFAQGGLSWTVHQRRRVGLLWAFGVKGYVLFPVAGGDIITETGVGGEGFARLGFIGPLGTSYLIKGFYQAATAPNADVTFNHEVFGYGLQVNFTF
jgi:hypothetical protein